MHNNDHKLKKKESKKGRLLSTIRQQRCAPIAMGEEMEPRNGSLPQDAAETYVMITAGTSDMDPPAKPPLVHMHRLRNLAVASIICGCSCLGVLALIYAVKATEKQKAGSQELAALWAQKSRRMSVCSIAVWLGLLILVPVSMVLLSYLLSQAE